MALNPTESGSLGVNPRDWCFESSLGGFLISSQGGESLGFVFVVVVSYANANEGYMECQREREATLSEQREGAD